MSSSRDLLIFLPIGLLAVQSDQTRIGRPSRCCAIRTRPGAVLRWLAASRQLPNAGSSEAIFLLQGTRLRGKCLRDEDVMSRHSRAELDASCVQQRQLVICRRIAASHGDDAQTATQRGACNEESGRVHGETGSTSHEHPPPGPRNCFSTVSGCGLRTPGV